MFDEMKNNCINTLCICERKCNKKYAMYNTFFFFFIICYVQYYSNLIINGMKEIPKFVGTSNNYLSVHQLLKNHNNC